MVNKIKLIVCVLIAGFLSFAASGQAAVVEAITPVKVTDGIYMIAGQGGKAISACLSARTEHS